MPVTIDFGNRTKLKWECPYSLRLYWKALSGRPNESIKSRDDSIFQVTVLFFIFTNNITLVDTSIIIRIYE